MATANQKITLSSVRDIPFNKLKLSPSNVRKVRASISVEELSLDIARRGLLQNLAVCPEIDADGKETGMYEVLAGGRRYQALALLVKQKRLSKTTPIPCIVRDPSADILAEDDSLAENIHHAPLHPLDQFRAFQTFREKGMSEEDIAAAYNVSAQIVRQRLRLASVSPVLLEIYADEGMTLEQLIAFTVNPGHARQEQVWNQIQKSWNKEPGLIRRMLTESAVPSYDKRVRFVGLDAYEAAGGPVLRDLFSETDGGYLQDVALLDRLVSEKLKTAAEEVGQEGWKWVTADVQLPYSYEYGLRALSGTPADLTEEERATREALRDEFDRLEAEYQDAEEYPDEVDRRLGEIEEALEAFEERPLIYDPTEIAMAGAFISIRLDGRLAVDRGYVRPEDEAPATETDGEDADIPGDRAAAVITVGGDESEPEEEEDDTIRPLPDRLMAELSAFRTLALRDAVARHPHVAMTALLHKLVSDTFHHRSFTGALGVSVAHVSFPAQDTSLKDSPAAHRIEERQEAWSADIPEDDEALWTWLDRLDEASRLSLLAHCVSFGVNALYEKPNPHSAYGVSRTGLEGRLAQADRLAHATGLDLVEAGWEPKVDNYLGRVTKVRILEAVREGAGERAAQLIDHLKKAGMAKEAERLLADTGWLPEPLRLITDDRSDDNPSADDTDSADLPDFLTGDNEDSASGDEPERIIAAE